MSLFWLEYEAKISSFFCKEPVFQTPFSTKLKWLHQTPWLKAIYTSHEIHSFIQLIFIEYVLYSRHYTLFWEYNKEQNVLIPAHGAYILEKETDNWKIINKLIFTIMSGRDWEVCWENKEIENVWSVTFSFTFHILLSLLSIDYIYYS